MNPHVPAHLDYGVPTTFVMATVSPSKNNKLIAGAQAGVSANKGWLTHAVVRPRAFAGGRAGGAFVPSHVVSLALGNIQHSALSGIDHTWCLRTLASGDSDVGRAHQFTKDQSQGEAHFSIAVDGLGLSPSPQAGGR